LLHASRGSSLHNPGRPADPEGDAVADTPAVSGGAVCVVNRDGRFAYVSSPFANLLGYGAGELLGREMLEFVHASDRERTREAARGVMQGSPAREFRNRYIHKAGRAVNLLWSARWSEEHQERIGMARDVTPLPLPAFPPLDLGTLPEWASDSDRALLHRVRRALEERITDPTFGVVELARSATLDRSHLSRRLRDLLQESPSDLILRLRLERARALLALPEARVIEVARASGFSGVGAFCTSFRKHFGMMPLAWIESLRQAPAEGPAPADSLAPEGHIAVP